MRGAIAIRFPAETHVNYPRGRDVRRTYWRAGAAASVSCPTVDATGDDVQRRLHAALESEFLEAHGHDVALDHASGLTNRAIRRAAARAGAPVSGGA